jgi:hypothetical protein
MEPLTSDLFRVHFVDVLGFAASTATLSAFAQKQMMPMRISALIANLFFIGYGALGPFYPVLLLHLILLPLNVGRLLQQSRQDETARRTRKAEHPSTLVEEWWQSRERFSYVAANLLPERPLDAANTQTTHRRVV